ncbi:hypothetical protein TRFO_08484 [Tritrichomonas foetus]|uniref:Uncharacterized protein n=1 Tax=Tritrichomonas foetus TaxID=1144522 RepID=A0A1J4JNZ1_9EUKA|nr:hypothetical protein TRFO_08484 [Tritrichomonas foetus]|eukprot:OHS99237.1 hypothetical protein TRFO_08484 [Tritrichomonas foetus]
MSAGNALRELASVAHDIRKVGWNKLPTGIEHAGLIICNTRAHINQQSPKQAAKMGKFAKYMELEVYYIIDPTVDEYIDVLRHFLTEVSEFLFVFNSTTKIGQDLVDEPPKIPLKGGFADPELVFDLLNCKVPESRVCFLMDGINDPAQWDPKKNGVTRDGVLVMAPYPDPRQASVEQFDSQQESLFAIEVNKIFKTDPEMTGKALATQVATELQPFGMRVFVASCPPQFATELNFAI